MSSNIPQSITLTRPDGGTVALGVAAAGKILVEPCG